MVQLAQLAKLGELGELGELEKLVRKRPTTDLPMPHEAVKSCPSLEQIEMLVLQPTPFCNLDCSYCYLGNRQRRDRMELATLRSIAERVSQSGRLGPDVTLVWHAGEPLVVHRDWYEEAFEILDTARPETVQFHHSVQTNGVLIDRAWCEFFKQHDVKVGVSLDGPAFLHDRHRQTRSGQGTHARVMAGVRKLQQDGVPFHVICVLTRESLNHADDLVDFFLEHGIECVGFNIDEVENIHTGSSMEGAEAESAFVAFLDRLVTRVLEVGPLLQVRELDDLLDHLIYRLPAAPVNSQTTPWNILAIDWAGQVSTFSPELLGAKHPRFGSFTFGNLAHEDFDAIASRPAFRRVRDEIAAGVEACRRSCPYFRVCGGGAPSNKLFETGSFAATETLFCRLTRQRVADVVLSRLEALLSNDATSVTLPDENFDDLFEEHRSEGGLVICQGIYN